METNLKVSQLMRSRGELAVIAALLLAYPGFRLGEFLGVEAAELPQAFVARPGAMAASVAVNMVLVGALYWLVLVWPRRKASNEQS